MELHDSLKHAGLLLAGFDDKNTLLRFLKARQWNVHKAEHMYKHMLQWREHEKVDELYKTFEFPELEAIRAVYPHFYHRVSGWWPAVPWDLAARHPLTLYQHACEGWNPPSLVPPYPYPS